MLGNVITFFARRPFGTGFARTLPAALATVAATASRGSRREPMGRLFTHGFQPLVRVERRLAVLADDRRAFAVELYRLPVIVQGEHGAPTEERVINGVLMESCLRCGGSDGVVQHAALIGCGLLALSFRHCQRFAQLLVGLVDSLLSLLLCALFDRAAIGFGFFVRPQQFGVTFRVNVLVLRLELFALGFRVTRRLAFLFERGFQARVIDPFRVQYKLAVLFDVQALDTIVQSVQRLHYCLQLCHVVGPLASL